MKQEGGMKCIRCGETEQKKMAANHICNKCRAELQDGFEKAKKELERAGNV
jgi:NMD protein affecting ribosome stability and mRNA decay